MSAEPPRDLRRVRMPGDLWERFDKAVKRAEPELDRSKILRQFVRWYVGDEGAKLPERPTPPT